MAPIPIALIGLSQSAKTSWASAAHLPYLLSPRGKQHYRIAALLNSSVSAAEAAIKGYNLDADTKAYGTPEDLAADPDVQIVVCTTRVDVHYGTVMPSVKAGKKVFVEWPLAENAVRADELAQAAKESGAKTVVDLQGRVMPAIRKLKEVIEEGLIGRVVSSDLSAFTPGGGGTTMSPGLAYFLDKKVGGNPITIAVGHVSDFVFTVLGDYENSHARLQIQRPDQTIANSETGEKKAVKSDVPDLISMHGPLKASEHVAEGATLTFSLRTGPPFPGTSPFSWVINGEKGRLRVSCERGPYIQAMAAGFPVPIEHMDGETGEVKQIPWEWEDWQEELPASARSVGKVYELIFEDRLDEFGVSDFDQAVQRHRFLDGMLY